MLKRQKLAISHIIFFKLSYQHLVLSHERGKDREV
jgi:hypothetical protein